MILFIGKKLQYSISVSKKLWRISEIRKRSTKYFKNINKILKGKIDLDEEIIYAIIETLQKNDVVIYDNLVVSNLNDLRALKSQLLESQQAK